MSNIGYLKSKFIEIAETGAKATGKKILNCSAEATIAGALGDSRHRLIVRDCLTTGYRETLESMAKLSIDLGEATNKKAQIVILKVSNDLAQDLVEKHAIALFGSPAFDRDAATRRARESIQIHGELEATSKTVIEDAKRSIVGHSRYGSAEESAFSFKPSFLWVSVDLRKALRKRGISLALAIIFAIALIGWQIRDRLLPYFESPLPDGVWRPLSNSEISKIEGLLRNRPVHSIFIACSNKDCQNLAQSFISLFGEIGWPSVMGDGGILAIGANGLLLNPEDDAAVELKSAIEKSTALQVQMSGIKRANADKNPIMLIIGTKPLTAGTS